MKTLLRKLIALSLCIASILPMPLAVNAQEGEGTSMTKNVLIQIYHSVDNQARLEAVLAGQLRPQEGQANLVNIPSETYLPATDQVLEDVFQQDTGAASALSLTETLGTQWDYKLTINLEGLAELIDLMGGITVTPELTFDHLGHSFTAGEPVTMDGSQMLAYVTKTGDEAVDQNLQARQIQVLTQIYHGHEQLTSFTRLPKLYMIYQKYVDTDLGVKDLIALVKDYAQQINSGNYYELAGERTVLGDRFIFEASDAGLTEASRLLAK